jgi:tRNA-(ms[2]io[6]A)-hydroxylase
VQELPLLRPTPPGWAELAARRLELFLADHAVCEQQAALTALNLIARYPEDDELVRSMSEIAAEEVVHLRRVIRLLHSRGGRPSRRRRNPYVQGLRVRMTRDREPELKVDRLLVGALIEARSCERFSLLLERLDDAEVVPLLRDLGPAEKRHWQTFHGLAARELESSAFERRWRRWLEHEDRLVAGLGREATVHG